MKTIVRYFSIVVACIVLSPVLVFFGLLVTVIWSFSQKTWMETAKELLET